MFYALVENDEIKRINIQLPTSIGEVSVGKNSTNLVRFGLYPITGTEPEYNRATQTLSGASYVFTGTAVVKEYTIEDIPLEVLKEQMLEKSRGEASQLSTNITNTFPECEVKSWTQQAAEATAWLADGTSPTPLVDSLYQSRGITKTSLCEKIITKSNAFTSYIGKVIGSRQKIEDMVEAATTLAELDAIPTIKELMTE